MEKFVNRDVNASINILMCAVLPKRPSILDRKKIKFLLIEDYYKTICLILLIKSKII
jgi:hypothetical protein